jgi:hypothetical protein
MLDATVKKLMRFLATDQPAELRFSTVRVLGELGLKDTEVGQALTGLIEDKDPTVRLEALTAVGKLRIELALPKLLSRISEGGPEAEAAAQAAAHLGSRGTKALQELMGQVAPGLRRRIAAALGVGGTSSASVAAVQTLLDTDPGVVDAATRSLTSEIPSFSEAQRRALADHVLELVDPKSKTPLSLPSEIALLRLLTALGDPRGETAFWFRTEPTRPPELRAAALQALGTLPLPQARDKVKRLFSAAADREFRVAAPALLMLQAVPVTDRALGDWLPLLEAPDLAARRFAMDKLAGKDTAELAAALLRQLRHPDRGLREEAVKRLSQMKHGREALAQALLQAEAVEECWSLARAQAPLAGEYTPALRERIFQQACTYLENGDRRADALLFLLRELDARALRDQLEERATAWRKKKNYALALVYLRLLTRDPACAESVRFDLAACGLKLSDQNLNVESRTADPALQQFARLIHNHEVDPRERLKQAKYLGAEDLFYLGFHFVEGDKQERDFGAHVLEMVIKRSARSKLAKDAKSKLRSAGLTK